MYYLGLFFYSFMWINSITAVPEKVEPVRNTETEVIEESITGIDECDNYNLDKADELKLLIDGFRDEEFIKIIFYSMLLKQNHSLYLCEIDKMIDSCFMLNNKRVNLNNVIRFVKAALFFGCSLGAGYMGYNYLKCNLGKENVGKRNLAVALFGVAGCAFGVHGLTELQKINNNYDQNQLYYKAIAIKNALLNYRK